MSIRKSEYDAYKTAETRPDIFNDWPRLGLHSDRDTLPVTVAKGAKAPTRAHDDDAGLDLYAHGDYTLHTDRATKVDTGIATAIPAGHVGLLFARSSLFKNYGGATLTNCVGVIDSGYRGPIKASLTAKRPLAEIHDGDKIVQLLIVPIAILDVEVVDELPTTERGTGGFGSTGRN